MRVLRLSVVTRIIGRNTCWNRERFVTQNKLLPLPREHDTIPNFVGSRVVPRENSGFGAAAPP
jgi:hypothetical protein